MKNVLPIGSVARQPRGLVKVNGTAVEGCVSFEHDANAFYHPDTFRAVFSVSDLPAANNMAWWLSQKEVDVELFAGFPADPDNFTAADLATLITGRADEISVDWHTLTLHVNGRDRTSKLADMKSDQKYPNLTASQIATQLAAKYGLTPQVTTTTTKVGKYYSIDHVDLHEDRTDWDLLTWLAREEQFVVFVKGAVLYFQPKPDPSQDPYVFQITQTALDGGGTAIDGNFIKLSTSREMTLAKDIKASVKSWHSKKKAAFERTASRIGGKVFGSGGPASTSNAGVQTYSYVIAGLEPDQAQARAHQLLAEVIAHEMKLTVEGPADNLLQMTDVIQLKGTGTAWDQIYYPDIITRSLSAEAGYTWRVEAKNHGAAAEPSP